MPNIPELDVYKKNINSIKQIDFNGLFQDLITSKILEQSILIPPIPTIELSLDKTNKFYRVRKNINTDKELSLQKTFSYPDECYCNQNGRANIKGKSIFYCSNEAITSLLETKPKDKEILYLGIWQPIAIMNILAATFCKKVTIEKNGILGQVELIKKSAVYQSLNTLNLEHFDYVIDFFTHLYKEELEPYYITSWFSNYILYLRNECNCILYQSVESTSFCNFAFHPNFINNGSLILNEVIKLEVEVVDNKYLNYLPTEIGIPNGINVDWRQTTEDEAKYYISIIKKDDEFTHQIPQ